MKKEKFLDTNIINKSKTVEGKIQLIEHNGVFYFHYQQKSKSVNLERAIELVRFVLVVLLILSIKKNLLAIHSMKNFVLNLKISIIKEQLGTVVL